MADSSRRETYNYTEKILRVEYVISMRHINHSFADLVGPRKIAAPWACAGEEPNSG